MERDEYGAALRMVGTHVDITESKMATEALEREALRHSILMQKSHDGIAIISHEHRIMEANERFAEMLGYSPKGSCRAAHMGLRGKCHGGANPS